MKIKDIIRLIEQVGWFFVATKGSHRPYKHQDKPCRVTISGHPSDSVSPGTWINNV